jgi:shikimate dehydrogenase
LIKKFGLLGEKLGHSFSPDIHTMIFEKNSINGEYHLFELKKEEIENLIKKPKDIHGLNVTVPYKTTVMDYLDEISPEARSIGAVNTITFKNGKSRGYNTDYHGFGMMLEKNGVALNGKTAVVLGTGGSSKAVMQLLTDKGVKKVYIVTRNKSGKDKEFSNFTNFEVIEYSELEKVKDRYLMINCTPIGMYPKVELSPVSKQALKGFSFAVDLIYNPEETLFLKYAKDLSIKTINGLYMLVGQAVKAEEIWNEIKVKEEDIDTIFNTIAQKLYK